MKKDNMEEIGALRQLAVDHAWVAARLRFCRRARDRRLIQSRRFFQSD